MKRLTVILLFGTILFIFSINAVFAQESIRAVIQELSGTVEIKQPGKSAWENAAKDGILTEDTLISTGFKSTALLAIGNSLLTVRPLTRLSLSEIQATAGTETLNVNLQTGRVRVAVSPPPGTRVNTTVRSPIATASVRGTVFEFDTINLIVHEGTVAFNGISGGPIMVYEGNSSSANENSGRAALPEEILVAELKPELPVSIDYVGLKPEPGQADNLVPLSVKIGF